MASLNDLLTGARLHGENGDPDHEVGDLQDLLHEAWALLGTAEREALLASQAAEGPLRELAANR